MRLLTILGTRPEIIRLSRVIPVLDAACDHILVHTGQNFEDHLGEIFFSEMSIRRPDENWGIRAPTFGDQAGRILSHTADILTQSQPDRVLILGDTNSGLSAIVAARMGIPVYHVEAGNRCYDRRVPEEINRRIIDHSSLVLLPYTQRSADNLVREGIARERIFVIGNPIFEVLEWYSEEIAQSTVLADCGLLDRKYLLATFHRAENVDDPARLRAIVAGLTHVAEALSVPLIVSLHPRTASQIAQSAISLRSERIVYAEPFGFFDFVHLERHALCVLTDSGTVQEECCILRVPSVTIRDVTERPETLECGSGILCGIESDSMLSAVHQVTRQRPAWTPPDEYVRPNVANAIARIICGSIADHTTST